MGGCQLDSWMGKHFKMQMICLLPPCPGAFPAQHEESDAGGPEWLVEGKLLHIIDIVEPARSNEIMQHLFNVALWSLVTGADSWRKMSGGCDTNVCTQSSYWIMSTEQVKEHEKERHDCLVEVSDEKFPFLSLKNLTKGEVSFWTYSTCYLQIIAGKHISMVLNMLHSSCSRFTIEKETVGRCRKWF